MNISKGVGKTVLGIGKNTPANCHTIMITIGRTNPRVKINLEELSLSALFSLVIGFRRFLTKGTYDNTAFALSIQIITSLIFF